MTTRYYIVADHLFAVEADQNLFSLMNNYEPFRTETQKESSPLFTMTAAEGPSIDYTEEIRQNEEGQEIICGHTEQDEPVFELRWKENTVGWLLCSADYRTIRLNLSGYLQKAALDNSLMIVFALASAVHDTVLFHSAVIGFEGRGYMFLGRSGTGKSTHASLWKRFIEGAELINDDNPAVRILPDGTAMVYGTPWSGKTPCYRNVSCPIGGIVLLRQAPYNKIRKLTGIEAYAAVVPGISGKRWDRTIADGLHKTENTIVGRVPVWQLECLPDEAAARLCKDSIVI
ncbi:MAG: hypothetical protein J6Y88_08415 [Bacteroidales bacterium]|nr:hypothetical protein [Bacteroidales bacterium]